MTDEAKERGTLLTRRIVLTGGAACALTLVIPRFTLGAADNRSGDAQLDRFDETGNPQLFVFGGSSGNMTVIAATWSAMSDYGCTSRFHAGKRSWSIEVPAGRSSREFVDEAGSRVFVGDILDRTVGHGARLKAVVIEAPTRTIASEGSTEVWAERISHLGSRFRIGSPFVERLVAGNAPAAKLYHASSPAGDGEELTQLVAEAVSVNARASGYRGDARSYGRRIASVITPDALRFNPDLPVGFTFAGQNGRHPDDAARSVADTVVNGTLAPQRLRSSLPLKSEFPYFPRPSSLV